MSTVQQGDTQQMEAVPTNWKVLLIQHEFEGIETQLAEAGLNVVHHTNNPMEWLESSIENLLSIDLVICSPGAVAINSTLAEEVLRVIEMMSTFMYVGPGELVQLSAE